MAGQAVPSRAHSRRLKLKRTWDQWWDAAKFDVLLCPVTPTPAIPVDEGEADQSKRSITVNGKDRG